MRILLATGNPKKRDELIEALAAAGVLSDGAEIEIVAPDEVGGLSEVIEDGATFAANAAKKARAAAREKGLPALADDSGLEVEHLDGAPGVHSARFAGVHGDDAANNRLLLERLEGVPADQRSARFTCALALAAPDGELLLQVEGHAAGRILESPRGDGDFGYDPLFLFTEEGFEESGRAFAELTLKEKRAVSHRGRALAELCRLLAVKRHPALRPSEAS